MSNDDPLHTLEILATKVGAAQPGLLDAFIAGTDNEQLTAKGREIATNRLVTDGVRLYQEAYAFWSNASPAQKESLKGFSFPLLTIAVHHLVALNKRQQSIFGSTAMDNQSKARRSGEADATAANALALRDQAYSALRDAA